ncbi:MAG TPA: FAD-dependent oxidoreductase [Acidimicrobiales bacterium]|nr:FAD-dependent oxidoreductase [Acidimicrobiales bacterium]
MPEKVLVIGGGIGGLASALAFARRGHDVTLCERDRTVPTESPAEAFRIERRGAPQAHQTHGFLARIVVLLREWFPDVLEHLLAQGCVTMPTTANLGQAQPGDDDLRVLIVRRTTLEWVLRKAVAAEPGVELRAGVAIRSLMAERAEGSVPVVTGAVTDTGERLEADIVVAATGRRGEFDQWLAPFGLGIAEEVEPSGLMYLSHWYQLPGDARVELNPKVGGDLGWVKFLAVPGDGGTLSVTLAIRADDRELRSALSTSDAFEQACRALPGPDQFFSGTAGPLPRLGTVRPMTGLINRIRRFVDADGRPLVLGLHAVGDSHTCTNPLYGRGCSLAVLQAVRLAEAAADHPGDARGRAEAYEAAARTEVEPWWQISVQMDKVGADPSGPLSDAAEGAGRALATVMVAGATDPIIGRAMARFWNLMTTPAELMADQELLARVTEVLARADDYPVPAREGPTRQELLQLLTGGSDAAADATVDAAVGR